ncbi:hypothetical protein BU23DRAFT_565764 [Bimuria novae-zelandiae CBS 107.79]|uniref:Uncharacterized protein n=1 Tax=Bimuria novae-zelandiae CBS 107.79 TaxID=1447943 RepID=A0A6A5VGE5_9PLEO|nr:hypothetical protein BU23DRAFT_565764 [Bimuria novae-zelandiae CBS 107.79]
MEKKRRGKGVLSGWFFPPGRMSRHHNKAAEGEARDKELKAENEQLKRRDLAHLAVQELLVEQWNVGDTIRTEGTIGSLSNTSRIRRDQNPSAQGREGAGRCHQGKGRTPETDGRMGDEMPQDAAVSLFKQIRRQRLWADNSTSDGRDKNDAAEGDNLGELGEGLSATASPSPPKEVD